MGIADWFKRKRSAPEVPQMRSIGTAVRDNLGWLPLSRDAHELTKTFGRRPWLHAATTRRAEAFANVQWTLFRARTPDEDVRGILRSHAQDFAFRHGHAPQRSMALQQLVAAGRLEQVLDHQILNLVEKPGQGIPGRALWELVSLWLDLTGEAFVGIQRNKRGRPIELVGVAPTFVERVPTYKRPSFLVRTVRGSIEVPKADMMWIRHMDPADPYGARGVGTAASLGDELDTDEAAAQSAKSRFFNRSMPDYLIGIENLAPDELARLEQEFDDSNRGPARTGRTHFIGGKFQGVPMSHTAVEAQYVQTRQFGRDTTLQSFGMPPEIVGVLANSNKSTISASKAHFAEFSTIPKLDRVQSTLQMELVPFFGRNYVLGYVSPMPEDREAKEKLMVALPHAFKKNEVRAAAGEPPVPVSEGGDDFMPSHGGAPPIPIEGDAPQDVPSPAPEPPVDDENRALRVVLGDALRGNQ